MKKVYIFDLDGTIVTSADGAYEQAIPLPGRIAKINQLYDDGHTIIIWTARGATSGTDWALFTIKQLASLGLKYHKFSADKPHYDVWVDDKAINETDFSWN